MQEVGFWYSKRFFVGVLAFFGQMNIFSLRANINMAILDMTSNRTETIGNITTTYDPEFEWDSKTKGFLLGVHSYGSLIGLAGGYLAWRFGGSSVISISSLVTSILTVLNPFAIRLNFYLFIIFRILEGASEGCKFVSFPELWTQWSPVRDRSKLMAVTLSGMYAGPAITYPVCGYLIQRYGWPAAFYFTGGVSLIWTVIWFIFVPNSPATDKWISKEELNYIQQDPQQGRPTNVISVWKNMLLSKPVYALCIVKLVYNFGLTVVVTCLPMYMKDLTHTRIDKVGIYSAIPTVINIFTIPVVGFIVDYLQNINALTISQIHKLFACSSFALGGLILFAMGFSSHDMILLMAYLTVFKLTVSVTYVIANLNAIVLAPKCSSIVTSFLSLFHMAASVIAPLIIGFIVTDHKPSQWNICFVTFGIISLFGALTFLIYGSGEPQPWTYSVEQQPTECDDVPKENKLGD
ncbi:vesicular glutamate transporter 3-like [Planococcus citri]|uniref:vesicular glutamate transporter 3-like n=1 Tax=Planococcus citri TaxID=170843 RepID=UPI0031F80DBF